MRFQAGDGVSIVQAKNRILVAATELESTASPPPSADPYLGLGFYSYVIISPPSVYVSPGALRISFPGTLGGGWANVDAPGNTVMPAQIFTDLTPDTTGFIVFKYAQGLTDAGVDTSAEDSDVDFGDPSSHYFVFEKVGTRTTGAESATVEQPVGTFSRYSLVFMDEVPLPSAQFFQQIICRVTVNAAGVPVVYPVHVGDIRVPLGYIGQSLQFLVDHND